MNTIQQFTPNYYQNRPIQANSQNVQFRGVEGNNLLKEISRDTVITDFVKKFMDKVSGALGGLKKDKVKDVFESFVGEIQSLRKEVNRLKVKSDGAESKIAKFPQEKQKAVDDVTMRMSGILQGKNEEIAGLHSEIDKLKKYEGLIKVKSVEEIGTIMPERAIEIMREMVKEEIPARKSMEKFLFDGNFGELGKVREQIERNVSLCKAQADGIFNIAEVAKANESILRAENLYYGDDVNAALRLISYTLDGSVKGDYLSSPVLRAQIKENAMALLRQFEKKDCWGRSNLENIERLLDKEIVESMEYHQNFAKAGERIKKLIAEGREYTKIDYKVVEFDPKKSKVILTGKRPADINEVNFYEFANYFVR